MSILVAQIGYKPPFTSMVVQVMNDAASLTRKSTTEAISSGSPERPSALAFAASFATCGTRAPIAVLIRPGAMAFTRMPCRPSRVPRLLIKLMTAAFDAPYSGTALPRWPASEAVLTIAPFTRGDQPLRHPLRGEVREPHVD